MQTDELRDYLNANWQTLRSDILEGNYRPEAVRKVEIPKSGGGRRMLGIPTVIDRLIQQAISQWLSPKFVAGSLAEWCQEQGIEWEYIQPGKPTQNSLIERFNRTFRQDVLDNYMFDSLAEVRKYAQAWVWMYNNVRPHSSLGHLTPVEFLLECGKLSEFPTFQQDNNNSNSPWNSLVLNVAS